MKKTVTAVIAIFASVCALAQSIGPDELNQIRGSFKKDSATVALQNVISHNVNLPALAANHANAAKVDNYFKYKVTPLKKVMDQYTSGRCWLFTSLNYIRPLAIEKFNVDDFTYSPNFCSFWDLFEKCNHALEIAIELRNEDINCPKLAHYYRTGLRDGGEWHSFITVAQKYGVVPEEVMAETAHSNATANMRDILNLKMKAESWNLREMSRKGASEKALREYKVKVMGEIYRILALCLGEPPVEFTWNYTDRDGKRHSIKTTPLEFFKSIVPQEFTDSRVMIMNDATHEYYKVYTIKDYTNAIEGVTWTYLNLPADDIKQSVLASIKNNEAVYTCCDWSKERLLPENVMAIGNYNYESLFGMSFAMPKEAREYTRYSKSAHVMLITACDTDETDKPLKWQLFNSSFSAGAKERLIFTDDWFGEYVFRIVLDKKYLSEKAAAALKTKPESFPLYQYEFLH